MSQTPRLFKINSLKYNKISSAAFAAFWLASASGAMALPKETAADQPPSGKRGFVLPVPDDKAGVGFGSYLSGRFARAHGDVPNALHYLQEAHEQQPQNMVIASQLRDAFLQQGDVDGAVKVAESMHAINDEESFSNLMLALQAIKKKDYAGASDILADAGDEASGQLWLPLIEGWTDVGAKTLKKPLTLEQLTANIGHAESIVNYHLGMINAAAGFNDAAANNFAHAVDNQTNPPGRVMSVILRFNGEHNSPKALAPLMSVYNKTHPKPVVLADELSITSPADGAAEVLFTMASVMMTGDMAYDAIVYLQLALYVKPDFPVASLLLGEAYTQLGSYEKSNQAYAKVPPSNEFYTKVQERMASSLDHMGNTDGALELLDKMAKNAPERINALMAKGDLLRQHKRFEEAGNVYSEALGLLPKVTNIDWVLYFARGVCYERQGKWTDAEKDLQKALELNPNQPEVLNYLAYGWLERGQNVSQARVMLEKAVRSRPNDPQILDSVGWALYLSGNYTEALGYIEKALDLLPADPEVNEHVGDVYWRLGRRTEARYQWERALIYKPEQKMADEINKKLKDGLPPIKVADTSEKKPL